MFHHLDYEMFARKSLLMNLDIKITPYILEIFVIIFSTILQMPHFCYFRVLEEEGLGKAHRISICNTKLYYLRLERQMVSQDVFVA